MKANLPNGLVIEGTLEQIVDAAKKLGFDLDTHEYYKSESKGWIRIKDMNTTHLRNAILKEYQKWVDEMHSIHDPEKLVLRMTNGIEDKTWLTMVTEYSTRPEE